jgi:hypothetical protein
LVDIRYDDSALHHAAANHGALADRIEPVVSSLQKLTLATDVLGRFPAAAAFGRALDSARVGCSHDLAREADARREQAGNTTSTALLGDTAVQMTQQVANSLRGSIINGR